MNYGGFYVERAFVELEEVKALSTIQFGILMKLFSLLAKNKRTELWGFLLDDDGRPLSERKIRYLCGAGGTKLSFTTWDATKKSLLEAGIIKIHKVRDRELLFCPVFVQMNKMVKSEDHDEKFSSDYFMGYDVGDQRPDKELDTWEQLCRQWLKLTDDKGVKLKPPFTQDMPLAAKEEAKKNLVELAEMMGIKNAVHDMALAFDIKGMQGGTITSMFYFISRWKSEDWHKRYASETVVRKKKNTKYKLVLEEAQFRVSRGEIKNYADLVEYFKHADNADLLKQVGRELKLNGIQNEAEN